ncbi:hypothetical protein HO173_008523 [Letharia columbiana]|uniref:Uncharacterized protein n=1 Tax=Letharia columbiana TaxID=112416 RepID=A0A8H6FRA0_9LECA|nr:uncharacterized protein HO173_008523 [Letharia columbiana]KAF6233234.1 hypothetical protein HO173_008523 [Letharia columbiana]
MNSRFVVMVELPEMSCSPQTLEHIVGQVRKFFDRLSSELRASTGQHLRATIGPWKAQHAQWAGECPVKVPQNSQNDASIPITLFLKDSARHDFLGTRPAQVGGVQAQVQLQGLDGRVSAGEGRGLEQRLAQGVELEDLNTLFPGHDFGTPFDASSSPITGQSHLYQKFADGFDINGQPLPPKHQLLSSNVTNPPSTRENDIDPQNGDEILICQAANNLAARPISEYAAFQGTSYSTLRWETPRSPADYFTPGLGRPSKSRSPSRKRG